MDRPDVLLRVARALGDPKTAFGLSLVVDKHNHAQALRCAEVASESLCAPRGWFAVADGERVSHFESHRLLPGQLFQVVASATGRFVARQKWPVLAATMDRFAHGVEPNVMLFHRSRIRTTSNLHLLAALFTTALALRAAFCGLVGWRAFLGTVPGASTSHVIMRVADSIVGVSRKFPSARERIAALERAVLLELETHLQPFMSPAAAFHTRVLSQELERWGLVRSASFAHGVVLCKNDEHQGLRGEGTLALTGAVDAIAQPRPPRISPDSGGVLLRHQALAENALVQQAPANVVEMRLRLLMSHSFDASGTKRWHWDRIVGLLRLAILRRGLGAPVVFRRLAEAMSRIIIRERDQRAMSSAPKPLSRVSRWEECLVVWAMRGAWFRNCAEAQSDRAVADLVDAVVGVLGRKRRHLWAIAVEEALAKGRIGVAVELCRRSPGNRPGEELKRLLRRFVKAPADLMRDALIDSSEAAPGLAIQVSRLPGGGGTAALIHNMCKSWVRDCTAAAVLLHPCIQREFRALGFSSELFDALFLRSRAGALAALEATFPEEAARQAREHLRARFGEDDVRLASLTRAAELPRVVASGSVSLLALAACSIRRGKCLLAVHRALGLRRARAIAELLPKEMRPLASHETRGKKTIFRPVCDFIQLTEILCGLKQLRLT